MKKRLYGYNSGIAEVPQAGVWLKLTCAKLGYTRSKIPAAPMPPPMHIVTMP
jgi:hypothetical protein